jgi:hypothetical protein
MTRGLNVMIKFSSMRMSSAIAALWLTAASIGAANAAGSRLQVFPFPEAIRYTHHNDDYTVRVRTPGGVWQDLYEYKVKVDLDTPSDASMVYFNFDGPVEVAVQKNNGRFNEVKIRPAGKGVKPVVKGRTAYFTLQRPENLSIEFDDDHLHNLHLFTHAIRKDMPAGMDKAPDFTQPVVYFGPGIHDGEFNLRSNTTVYIDGGAVLKKPLVINGVENVKVISDGLFDSVDMLTIKNSRHVLIDGPIFFNQPHGTMRCITSQDIEERSIRTIGAGKWSDGLGHFACERVTVADSFIRTSDDSITLYNHRWDIWGNTRDIVVKDSTLWADIAHAVMIGIHGNTPTPAHPEAEVLERIRFSNIDILDHDEDDPEYEGAIGIMAGDDNLVRDVTFEDIRIDRIEEGKLFNLHIAYTPKYNTSPGRGIENITLRNISFTGDGSPSASVIYGHDAQRKVRNIVIDNVTVGGRKLKAAEPNVLDIGPFVEGVSFK